MNPPRPDRASPSMPHTPGHHDDQVPPRLADALRAAQDPVSADDLQALDSRIRTLSRAHFARGSRRSGILARITGASPAAQRIAAALAAAAAIALTVWLVRPTVRTMPQRVAAGDPSHAITILDAFTLARRLRDGVEAPPETWDANADGLVDHRDVEALAASAVRLTSAPSQREGAGGRVGFSPTRSDIPSSTASSVALDPHRHPQRTNVGGAS